MDDALVPVTLTCAARVTWTASALFHTRDFMVRRLKSGDWGLAASHGSAARPPALQITEFMDYACANVLLASSLVFGIVRLFYVTNRSRQRLIFVMCMTLFAVHVVFLIKRTAEDGIFPYGYNMYGASLRARAVDLAVSTTDGDVRRSGACRWAHTRAPVGHLRGHNSAQVRVEGCRGSGGCSGRSRAGGFRFPAGVGPIRRFEDGGRDHGLHRSPLTHPST